MVKQFFFIAFWFQLFSISFAQKTEEVLSEGGVKKYYTIEKEKSGPEEWKASWIWIPGVSNEMKNHIMLARKTFEVDNIPSKAMLYITADSHYKLWVNGKFVTRGPARCDAHHQSYDIVDVAPVLTPGKNVIAVQVHYHGIMKSYYNAAYPGLLVQLELGENENKQYIKTDKTWKVIKDAGWDSNTKWVNHVNANNFSSIYDFNSATSNWQSVNFSDNSWSPAVYQFGLNTWPSKPPQYEPYAVQKPWVSLVGRDLPPLVERDIDVYKVLQVTEAPQYSKYDMWGGGRQVDNSLFSTMQDVQKPLRFSEVKNLDNFLKGKAPLIVSNSYPKEKFVRQPAFHTTLVFDFDKVLDGYPYMKMKGKAGTVIDVNYVPYLIDNSFMPGVLMQNFSDRLVLSGGDDVWEVPELRTFRYMSVTVRGDEPVTFQKIGFREEEYPFQKNGDITVDAEPFLKALWNASENTLLSITTDAYTDNYHERRQYVQTSFYASRANYASFGDPYLQRRYLVQHAQNQLPDGIMPMWAPWGIYEGETNVPGIFEANHFWLMGLHDYYLFTGDEKTTRELLVNAERCAQAIHQVQRKDNLIYKPPYSYWIDWAKLAQGDQNFIINTLQLLAFKDYAELLTWLGEDALAAKWNAEADKMKQSLKPFWSTDKQMFADNRNNGKLDANFSEHANALAVIAGIATDEQAKIIVQKIINNEKNRVMEEAVLFNYWIAEAICKQGHISAAMDFLKKRYQYMVNDKEIGTLWEYANIHVTNIGKAMPGAKDEWRPQSWSTAQGENTFPASTLSRWVLGIHPAAPGIKEVIITSLTTPYKTFSGKVPSPQGIITISKKDNSMQLQLPNGISGRIPVSQLQLIKGSELVVDGKSLRIATITTDVILPAGNHLLLVK
jgi:hypothetical protein